MQNHISMKKSIFIIVLVMFIGLFSSEVAAQKFIGLDKSPMDVASYPSSYRVSNKVVKVIYSRPQLKGRKLSKLAPKGKVWRTGANEATEIIFYKDVILGGKPVKAGRYSMFTIPNDKEWTVILNTAENVWGSYFYNENDDVVRVQGKVSIIRNPIEVFSIGFDGKEGVFTMYLGWGNVVISVPVISES